jgi:predicted amidohydrolase YtcJ
MTDRGKAADLPLLNGILRELAINLVQDALPELRKDKTVAAMRDGIAVLHSLGITGVHDIRLMGGIEGANALRAWQHLRESGGLCSAP